MTNAEYFKQLRDLYTLYEAADNEGKVLYAVMIKLKIEEIKLDGAEEFTNEMWAKNKTTGI